MASTAPKRRSTAATSSPHTGTVGSPLPFLRHAKPGLLGHSILGKRGRHSLARVTLDFQAVEAPASVALRVGSIGIAPRYGPRGTRDWGDQAPLALPGARQERQSLVRGHSAGQPVHGVPIPAARPADIGARGVRAKAAAPGPPPGPCQSTASFDPLVRSTQIPRAGLDQTFPSRASPPRPR